MKKILVLLLAFILSYPLTIQSQNLGTPAPAPELIKKDKGDDELSAEEIIDMNKPALISIWYHTDNYYSYYSYERKDTTLLNGSGFLIREDGLIGTNFHVVDEIDSLLVKTSDGTFYDAELLMVDEINDVAIIRIKNPNGTKFPVIKFANSDNVKVGNDVYAIGSPLGFEYTISQGIVAGIRIDEKVSFTDPVTYEPIERKFEKVIQITAAISPGNSGGALFNTKGEVIGITTYTYSGYGNLNFAIAINSFVNFKNSLDLTDLDHNEEFQKRRITALYNTSFKMANNYKSQVTYNWYYTKQKDTMKTKDSFVVQQDSINQVNFSKAENLYNKCLSLQPDSFDVYRELMDLYVYTEKFDRAEGTYISIKEKFKSDSLLNLLSSSLASAYSSTKNYDKAMMFYNKMLKQDSTDTYIYYQIANLYEQMGKYNKAIKEYNRLIKRDSSYSQAYVQCGTLYYNKLNDIKKAKKYFEAAREMEILNYGNSSVVDIYYYLGLIAVKEKNLFDAMVAYFELKSIYTYSYEDNQKKLHLFKELQKLR